MKKNLVFIILLFVAFSCEKVEDYSDIPNIKFKDFVFNVEDNNGFINQVGYLTFEFTDGNGDIGFYQNSDSILEAEIPDVFIYEYTKTNGNFVITDTITYLMPYFSEGVYRKYIKGDMEIRIYYVNQSNDTLKYDFQIMDREYHMSNLESTPELIVPDRN